MRLTGFAIAVVLVLISSSNSRAQSTQTPASVSYATFMRQDHEARLRTFERITTENRANLVLEQIARWMEVNRNYLTQEQRRVLRDFMNVVAPPLFRVPGERDTLAWRNELQARAEKVFSAAQIRQALAITEADYIPWQW